MKKSAALVAAPVDEVFACGADDAAAPFVRCCVLLAVEAECVAVGEGAAAAPDELLLCLMRAPYVFGFFGFAD